MLHKLSLKDAYIGSFHFGDGIWRKKAVCDCFLTCASSSFTRDRKEAISFRRVVQTRMIEGCVKSWKVLLSE
ncbi:hypothetical protein ADA01nite_21140 [Aneurinibacillus danicus]|uniref:Uncharacterized protein n=1 Tax=Aneurinibacillus danicus TaxID=267746 RepID=A0A511V6S9_9BACL|nr:hypothetical protein ADA01nite_21140 [Aneurinibacillus danicus]